MSDTTYTAQEARNELYEIIRRETPFETKAEDALRLGAQYLGADNGHLTRINQETDHWKTIASTDPASGQFPPGLELDLGTTYCRRTIESNAQIALSDAPNQGWADDPAFVTHGLHCYHGTPLIVDGEPYGTVCFVADDPRDAFSDGETMFTELIARLLERELERKQHEAELTRQANLATVLNRVLRHNLRNDLAVIRGHTEIMAEQLDDTQSGETALRNIDKLIGLGQKARELEQVISETADRNPTDIAALIEYVVERVTQSHPNASISVDCDDDISVAVLANFERAIMELVENAAKHCGEAPTVTVTVDSLPNALEIHVADDGPGLSEQERTVLREGAETPLVHGSGLGLWLTHWIIDSHDGSVETTVTDQGTTMTVSIPRLPETGSESGITELTRARDQYKAAFEEATDALLITDDEGRIVDANAGATAVFGLDRKQLLGRSLQEFLPAEFDFNSEWQQFQTDTERRDTVTIHGADGVDRAVEYAGAANVVPGQHLFVARDVTARNRREAELEMKTQAMDEAPIGIAITDPTLDDNPMVYANDQFCELTGYDRAEILGRNCRFMQGPASDPETVDEIRQGIESHEPVSVTLQNYRKDGTQFWNKLDIAPVRDDTGELTHWVGFQQKLSEYSDDE
ncbi:PAS domain S-box-containing protein [Halohasta litchfieldiae]|jgi:PAS domain S-box-containing protein|uniref:PAS domain S-box-containing protein n=1 Tax=Halohasta litchfieldiae TaxID=1073996 RepID=A0A1H6V4B2_9EURY|nr:PAS domain-containing protein [Halohasta litchfieldiae]ATW87508.1 PAS domain S-box-containing protein [Halohasta litchfieldiae]SEI99479.1 PAS domain S-box-containing protein [Halohasta litchfieldiae]